MPNDIAIEDEVQGQASSEDVNEDILDLFETSEDAKDFDLSVCW